MASAEASENVSVGESSTGETNEFCYWCGEGSIRGSQKDYLDEEEGREIKICGECSKRDLRFGRITATAAKKNDLLDDMDLARQQIHEAKCEAEGMDSRGLKRKREETGQGPKKRMLENADASAQRRTLDEATPAFARDIRDRASSAKDLCEGYITGTLRPRQGQQEWTMEGVVERLVKLHNLHDHNAFTERLREARSDADPMLDHLEYALDPAQTKSGWEKTRAELEDRCMLWLERTESMTEDPEVANTEKCDCGRKKLKHLAPDDSEPEDEDAYPRDVRNAVQEYYADMRGHRGYVDLDDPWG